MSDFPKTCPLGRLDELRSRPGAYLVAYTVGPSIFDDYRIRKYNSRAQLRAFCKPGSKHHALVKDRVRGNLLSNRNTQRPIRPQPEDGDR